MTIQIGPAQTVSEHVSGFAIQPQGQYVINVSGVALVNFPGTSTAQWHRDNVEITVDLQKGIDQLGLPSVPLGQHYVFHARTGVPHVTINAIYNAGVSNSAGWAVDEFGFTDPLVKRSRYAVITAKLAARDTDGILYRVGYTLQLIGHVDAVSPVVIETVDAD